MFENEFLTSERSGDVYRRRIAEIAQEICEALPDRPYSGRDVAALADLVGPAILPAVSSSTAEVARILRSVVANAVQVRHPFTAAHLHCPPLLASLAAEVVISALNQSMDSFDQAPFATIVEQKLVRWLCDEAGLPAAADGTFTTGGSQSNYMGLLLARDRFLQKQWNWSAQKSGLPPNARRLRILCSDVSHFTVEKSASQLGLGTDAVVRVAVDHRFRMDVAGLRSALHSIKEQELFPMAIVATAGTTDFGSMDPLVEVNALARDAGAWLHVDAAYGGALLFSESHREKLAGIETADSIAIDFHKLVWQPIPCSVFLLRDARLFEPIKLHVDYLNPEGHEQMGIPNLVTTSLLTSRRFDALKLWVSFQTLGRAKLGSMIDRTIALANYAAQVIRDTPQLELAAEPQLGTVVFRFVSAGTAVDADELNARLRQSLFERGLAVIGHTRVRGRQYLKFTCMNPAVTDAQMKKLVELVVAQGDELR